MPEFEAEGPAVPESQNPQEISFAGPRATRRRRRIGAGVALGAGAAAAVAVALGAGPSASQGASQPAKSSGAATVARRDLVSTDTESGTLGYASAQTVFNRLSGTITSLPVVGKVIDPGQTLYHVDGAPVVLFDGGTPAYRDLSDGVSNGLDVQELKLNLKALGFDSDHQITVNQTFDAATTAAVDRWQASLGQTQTGTVTLGQIVFLPGPQRITQVDTVLGSTGGASSGAAASGAATTTSGTPATGSALSARTAAAAPRAEFVGLTTKVATPGARSGKSTTTCPRSVTNQIATSGSDTKTISQTKQEIAAICRQHTTSASKTASQTLAALIALLRAETLVLKRGSSGSSTGTGTGRTGSGTGASTGSGGGRSSGGGAAGTGASGGSGTTGAAASSGGGSSGGGSSGGGGSASTGTSGGGGTAQAILQTSSTQLVVTVDLDATKQSEAIVGQTVTVQLPNGDTVEGKITGVSPVAQAASSSSSSASGGGGGGGSSSSTPSATVPVTITLKGHQAETGLDQAAVSVNFEQQVENNVLSVPVTALLATAGGGYAVQEASAPHRLIPVTPGLFAAGFVRVSGAGIYPGLAITDSQG